MRDLVMQNLGAALTELGVADLRLADDRQLGKSRKLREAALIITEVRDEVAWISDRKASTTHLRPCSDVENK
ncbi:MAG TPA: hypothetical protein VJW23_12915, partial [Propionibacteriaceae bacterium]|nr:hypothetical protein [Propionibacteriaceae bacterium]